MSVMQGKTLEIFIGLISLDVKKKIRFSIQNTHDVYGLLRFSTESCSRTCKFKNIICHTHEAFLRQTLYYIIYVQN